MMMRFSDKPNIAQHVPGIAMKKRKKNSPNLFVFNIEGG